MPYHVLPHLAIEGAPGEWRATFQLLLDRGASTDDALKQIAFAYSGHPLGALPEELRRDVRTELSDRCHPGRLHDAAEPDTWLVR